MAEHSVRTMAAPTSPPDSGKNLDPHHRGVNGAAIHSKVPAWNARLGPLADHVHDPAADRAISTVARSPQHEGAARATHDHSRCDHRPGLLRGHAAVHQR